MKGKDKKQYTHIYEDKESYSQSYLYFSLSLISLLLLLSAQSIDFLLISGGFSSIFMSFPQW